MLVTAAPRWVVCSEKLFRIGYSSGERRGRMNGKDSAENRYRSDGCATEPKRGGKNHRLDNLLHAPLLQMPKPSSTNSIYY